MLADIVNLNHCLVTFASSFVYLPCSYPLYNRGPDRELSVSPTRESSPEYEIPGRRTRYLLAFFYEQ